MRMRDVHIVLMGMSSRKRTRDGALRKMARSEVVYVVLATVREGRLPVRPDPFTRVEVPHLPADEVFHLAEKAVDDDKQMRLDDFLGSIEHTELEGLSIEKVLAEIQSMSVSDTAKQFILQCFESAMAP